MRSTLIIAILFSLIACQNSEDKSTVAVIEEFDNSSYHLGDSISLIAQQTLLSNVANAMQKGGSAYAVEFCNLNALNIVDSLSNKHNVKISRISDKNRNIDNAPSEFESSILKQLEKENLKDTIITIDGSSTYYKSIRVGLETCLKCHGPIDSIDPTTYDKIAAQYPNDKAIDYSLKDFRGAWKIVL